MNRYPQNNDTKKYWLGLKMLPTIRNRIYLLVEKSGDVRRLWESSRSDLMELGLSKESAEETICAISKIDLNTEYENLLNNGVCIITDEDNIYPEPLRHVPNRPKSIFVKGNLSSYRTAVAIVGARRSTIQGKAIAQELARDIAGAGVAIVSGAARGIDTSAHWGAIDVGGVTYAVLGCGHDFVYPPENRELFDEIVINGAIISEYPPATSPLPQFFPARNRIIAGMSHAVVVVEAGKKSGALITVDFALDYGIDVFAVPGNSKNPTSQGSNGLIKQGAYLIDSANDVLEVLGIDSPQTPRAIPLTDLEKLLLDSLGWEGRRIDELATGLTENISSISAALLSLELNGFLKKDLAGSYIRLK